MKDMRHFLIFAAMLGLLLGSITPGVMAQSAQPPVDGEGPPTRERLIALAAEYPGIEFNSGYTGAMPSTEAMAREQLEALAAFMERLGPIPFVAPAAPQAPLTSEQLIALVAEYPGIEFNPDYKGPMPLNEAMARDQLEALAAFASGKRAGTFVWIKRTIWALLENIGFASPTRERLFELATYYPGTEFNPEYRGPMPASEEIAIGQAVALAGLAQSLGPIPFTAPVMPAVSPYASDSSGNFSCFPMAYGPTTFSCESGDLFLLSQE